MAAGNSGHACHILGRGQKVARLISERAVGGHWSEIFKILGRLSVTSLEAESEVRLWPESRQAETEYLAPTFSLLFLDDKSTSYTE